MTRRREGTLEELPTLSSNSRSVKGKSAAVQWRLILEASEQGFFGLEDFLTKADRLADELLQYPATLRAKQALALKRNVLSVRKGITRGAVLADSRRPLTDKQRGNIKQELGWVLLDAVGAGLAYAALSMELRQDNARLTRTAYFKHEKCARNRTELASLCRMTLRGLRNWEARNLTK